MSTQLRVELFSDDEDLRSAIAALDELPLVDRECAKWDLYRFVCDLQLRKAERRRGVAQHYDAKSLRARQTRAQRQGAPT